MPFELAPTIEDLPDPVSPHEILAEAVLRRSLVPAIRLRLSGQGPIAIVVQVPSPDWIEPIADALRELRNWHDVIEADATARKRPASGPVAKRLARGESIAGVASAPTRQLPAALIAAADATVVIGGPDNAAIRKAIRHMTGRKVGPLPSQVAAGLDYFDVVAAIRKDSTPSDCVRRLLAASRSMSIADAAVQEAPPLGSLHGYGEAMDWGTQLVSDLGAWRQGNLPFEAIRRCVVLASEPGLGKSSFVRSLAKTARLPLFATSVGEWFATTDGHLNSVIQEMERVFSKAASVAPALVFVDELDGLPDRRSLAVRGSQNADYWLPLITRILTILDSATSGISSRLCVIGATNHADRIDPALIRPGRLERVIMIHPPKPRDLAGILRQHLGNELEGVDLMPLAELAHGASGAQVAGWVKDARARARGEGVPMCVRHLVSAMAPPDERTQAERMRFAYHEAAHAVLAHRMKPGSVASVSIIPRGDSAAQTATERLLSTAPTRAEIERDVVVTLAGRAAEIVRFGEPSSGAGGSAGSDLAIATRAVVSLYTTYGLGGRLIRMSDADDGIEQLRFDLGLRAIVEKDLVRLHDEAERLVRLDLPVIGRVARALLRSRHLSGSNFVETVEATGIDPVNGGDLRG